MIIEATAQDIDALLQLAELDARPAQLTPDAQAARREPLRRRLPGPVLERYETLLEVGRTPPVTPITDGSCSGCHVRLPTMVESKARRIVALYNCPHCHRMLYVPELLLG